MEFIRAVQPQIIVVEYGRRKFGAAGTRLPDQTVLDRYAKEFPTATILRTDFFGR